MDVDFVSKVHIYVYKMHMHHSEGKHHNRAANNVPWSCDSCGVLVPKHAGLTIVHWLLQS